MVYFALYRAVDILFQALYLALLIRVLMSWIHHDPDHPIMAFLYRVTDPMLRPFQGIVPAYKIGFDISPIFAFLALGLLKKLVFSVL